MSCHGTKNKSRKRVETKNTINIALAGNPNVGKSVIFNQLTGLSQTIGNWPGKTVEKMEGHLDFHGFHFNIVDLPGIYSLSTYSLEEIVSREYIISDDVDLIINVIDATNLERNLFFTFQLLELEVPMILAINQMDLLRKRNIELNFRELEKIFKLPVLPVVAVHGTGVHNSILILSAVGALHFNLSCEISRIERVPKGNGRDWPGPFRNLIVQDRMVRKHVLESLLTGWKLPVMPLLDRHRASSTISKTLA